MTNYTIKNIDKSQKLPIVFWVLPRGVRGEGGTRGGGESARFGEKELLLEFRVTGRQLGEDRGDEAEELVILLDTDDVCSFR
jgi:hypothetical protein